MLMKIYRMAEILNIVHRANWRSQILQTKAKTEDFDGVFSFVRELTNQQLAESPYFLFKNISSFKIHISVCIYAF